jgi:SAM-dependent methyltransferase
MSSLSRTIASPIILARRVTPQPVRSVLRAVSDRISYAVAGLPPRRLRAWISPTWFDFHDTGRDQLEFFVEMAGLRPSHRVLDIACGVGRLAIPLARYLNENGSYDGFDIKEELIEWCQRKISARRPNFQFQIGKVATRWSPHEQVSVAQYRFPYADDRFDLAYAGSIFTHILPDGAENYLRQTARVLKPGGRLVATWLVYNKRTVELTQTISGVQRNWKFDHGDFRVKDDDQPEASIAYEEGAIRRMYAEAGLEILEPLRPDASYNAARIPANRSEGIHLHHCLCIVAVRPNNVKNEGQTSQPT